MLEAHNPTNVWLGLNKVFLGGWGAGGLVEWVYLHKHTYTPYGNPHEHKDSRTYQSKCNTLKKA